jgi:hypothetical protein
MLCKLLIKKTLVNRRSCAIFERISIENGAVSPLTRRPIFLEITSQNKGGLRSAFFVLVVFKDEITALTKSQMSDNVYALTRRRGAFLPIVC